MYHGLLKLVLMDPSSGGAVFDFLLPHFLHFFREVIILWLMLSFLLYLLVIIFNFNGRKAQILLLMHLAYQLLCVCK